MSSYPDVEGWPWLPHLCPPDEEFIEWVKSKNLPPQVIFHMGTGLHHRVGINCCEMGHSVIGMTVSREEVVSRVFRVESPNYQVLYTSLKDLNFSLLPTLDVVTLFHFGEMAFAFGEGSYYDLWRVICNVRTSGYILFYNRSANWTNAKEIVTMAVDNGAISHKGTYKDLEIYVVNP